MSLANLLSPDAYRKLQVDRLKRTSAEKRRVAAPEGWQTWLETLFPLTFNKPFADRHMELWAWLETIEANTKPAPAAYIDVEPRGGGKTTTAESGVIRLGATGRRNFILYVKGIQNKANESVQSIAAKLESQRVAGYYPLLSERSVGKYGQSRGWRMDMLRCASGFNVLALGLDVAVRGAKIEDYRPDFIIFDDIDEEHDTPKTIQKKIDIITKSILPSGTINCGYLVVQNLIHAQSIVKSLVEGTAEFMNDRIVSGPHPAVLGLAYESRKYPERGYRIVGGQPTWAGQNLQTCEAQINDWGLSAFLREAQHEVEDSGGIWEHIEFRRVDHADLPDFVDGEVWVDPAVTATDNSDCQSIAAGGIDEQGDIYVVYCWEAISSPLDTLKRAILKAIEYGFRYVGVETDQGGDTWKSVFSLAWKAILESDDYPFIITRAAAIELGVEVDRYPEETEAFVFHDEWLPLERPSLRTAKAGAGHGSKVERNQRMLTDYEHGRVIHAIGTHTTAEKSLRRFPIPPLDLADALYWLWYHLQRKRIRSRIA